MKRSALLLFVILTLGRDTMQAQDKITIFGGYSYLRPSLTQTETFICPPGQDCHVVARPQDVNTTPSLHGLEVSGTLNLKPWFGVKGDFSYHHGTALAASSADFESYLFGSEFRRPGRLSPFAHVLVGVVHESTSMESIAISIHNTLLGTNDTAFAFAFGGGIDVKVKGPVSVRPFQVDYLRTNFSPTYSPDTHSHGQPRVSAGLVLRF
jgi:opacity protein-like surface antigen